jgi:CsoR family transcriptional regulator, copper-sensing transcriptional repressor
MVAMGTRIEHSPAAGIAALGEQVRGASYTGKTDDLLLRLRKMEGQARGLQQMITDERYCLDVIQQINALTAAAREVEIILLESHVRACIVEASSGEDSEAAIREMTTVLRKTLRP